MVKLYQIDRHHIPDSSYANFDCNPSRTNAMRFVSVRVCLPGQEVSPTVAEEIFVPSAFLHLDVIVPVVARRIRTVVLERRGSRAAVIH
jgi:hypothetical protein